MESTLRALRIGAILSALVLSQSGCCTIDLNCGTRACGSSCGPAMARDPLFDGTLRHRVKGRVHSCANKIACAGGCGEIYWDESINDPAVGDRCDHVGMGSAGCGSCSPWFVRLAKLWGTPYRASCGSGTCASGCSDGSCLGHGSLMNHLQGQGGVFSNSHAHGSHVQGGCRSCSSCSQGSRSMDLDGVHDQEVIYDSGIHNGNVIHEGEYPSKPAPTPANPRVSEPRVSEPRESEGQQSAAPSSAQQRMRLHQRPSQTDPNGRLSAQLVNGQRRLVSNP